MRPLRDVVRGVGDPRRRRLPGALLAFVTLAALLAMTGCSRMAASLSQREAVVSFHSDTTVQQRMAVRTACARAPAVTPPPLPADVGFPYALQPLIYRIDHASDADVATLEKCLARFRAVAGVTLRDSSDTGS